MSRFKRFADLRRIREEISSMAYARVNARMEGLKQSVIKLDQVTAEEGAAVQQAMAQGNRFPPEMVEDFLKGQSWRRKRLEQMIVTTQQDLEKAKESWLAARVQLKQAESLAEQETLRQHNEAKKREMKEMDMVGIVRNRPFSGQGGAF